MSMHSTDKYYHRTCVYHTRNNKILNNKDKQIKDDLFYTDTDSILCVKKAVLQYQTHPVVLCCSAYSVSLIPVRKQSAGEISKTLVTMEMKEMLMCFQTLCALL